jgi:hypothetical protein
MLTPDQRNKHKDLKEDVKDYIRYFKWQLGLIKYGAIPLLLIMVVAILMFNQIEGFTYFLTPFYIFAIAFLIASGIFEHYAKLYYPTADKLVSFYVFEIIYYLDRYLDPKKAKTPQLKKKYRNKAKETASALSRVIKNNWVVGDFDLGKKEVGQAVNEFKELLTKRLIPIIKGEIKEKDHDSFLKKVNDIFWQFSVLLPNLTTENLEKINEMVVDTKIPEISTTKGGYSIRFWNALKGNKLLIVVFSILGIAGLTWLVYFAGVNYIGATPESAYGTSMTVLATLIVGCATVAATILIKKKEK